VWDNKKMEKIKVAETKASSRTKIPGVEKQNGKNGKISETKQNKKKSRPRNETKRNETKRNETKRNETKRNETKRNETKRNELIFTLFFC
jgi:hypothetical protein